ncbi:5' nucleotidase, NT5C type [Thermoanaerobacterium thermosaccharolyticum]|uniref:5' nucleotidase, NT5C type n=1 Tax=Thermoanaerobacterium thermosaccharolyticum TaxID=1517 RepID=UPI002FD89677
MTNIMYFNGKVKDLKKFTSLLTNVKSKLVCCDIDNTLANVNAQLLKAGYDTSQYPNPALNDDFWTSYEGFEILIKAQKIKNTSKILDVLDELGADIFFATSRDMRLKELTRKWIEKNGIYNEHTIYFTATKHILEADIYIEDNPEQISKLLSIDKPVLIPSWQYNQGFDNENAIYFNI